MELFSGDNQQQIIFPENLTPFPGTGDLISGDPPAEISSPEIVNHSQPQKLRPIRCNGGLAGTLDPAPELGFGGGVCEISSAVEKMKVEMGVECMKLMTEGRVLMNELSSSSDDINESSDTNKDGNESSETNKEPLNRKRKRKSRKTIQSLLETMMNKVVQKQEQMHKQLIETLEKKEKERIAREEAWKQHELERAKRDEQLRAQETSRSLALISFIQNLLGHEIQIPKTPEEKENEAEMHNQEEFKCDSSSKRWPKSEVQALITVRTALEHKFLKGPKGAVWEEVSVNLSNMGYSRTAKKCKEKWDNINKYYKRTMESGKKRMENSKSCPYFQELEILHKGLIASGNGINCIKNEIEERLNE